MNNEIAPEEMETEQKWEETPYCFICSRCCIDCRINWICWIIGATSFKGSDC